MSIKKDWAKQNGRPSAKRGTMENCKTLTSISPAVHLSSNRYTKCKQNIQG